MSIRASRMELVHRARSGVREMRDLLLRPTPDAVERCAGHLEEAIGMVQRLEGFLDEPGAEAPEVIRAELMELRYELKQARALLAQAFEAHAGWYRLLAAMLGGYSREGKPALANAGNSFAVEG